MMLGLPPAKVLGKIIDACNKAASLGAKVVGLGAFTAVVGDAGVTIRRNVDIAVTTGNSYTVATAIEATEKAAKLMDIDMDEASVLILGASGSIGRTVSLVLADEGRRLTLCARDTGRLSKVASGITAATGMVPRITRDLRSAVREADVLICVSSATDAIVEPTDLKPGALVCDVSRPRNVSPEVRRIRDDVLVIEGGVVTVPGDVDFNLDFGFPPRTSYACMAETMILAMEENYVDWSLGRELPVGRVRDISRLAAKHGFQVAGMRSFERSVSLQEIERVKESARKNRPA